MIVLANVMIPTVAEHVVIMLLVLFPVALIEAAILAKRHDLKGAESFALTLRANLRSTFVGLPLGYACAFLGLIPAGLFAMLLPDRIESAIGTILGNAVAHGGTMPHKLDEVGFFLGTLLVMIPYFLVTLRVERKYLIKRNAELNTPALPQTVRLMNAITYGALALPLVVGTVKATMKLASNC